MRSIMLVAACWACAGHASRLQTSNPQQQVKHVAEQTRVNSDMPDLKRLTTLLLASIPQSAFTPSVPGMKLVTTGGIENDGVRMTASTELLQKQKKIAELEAQLAALKQQQQGQLRTIAAQKITVPSPRRETALQQELGQPATERTVVQGGALRTWSYDTSLTDRVQVVLGTDGRPLNADVELWLGPDNTPCKMRVYSEDGSTRPFSAVIATPDVGASTVAIYNVGKIEYPLDAYVTDNDVYEPISDFRDTSMIVQGGALRTYDFNSSVQSVELMLKTDGRPLNARIELLQGPNNIKEVIELYTEDGLQRPFFAIFDTIGTGNVVRVVNTAPLEFPMFASVQPHSIDVNVQESSTDPVVRGGTWTKTLRFA